MANVLDNLAADIYRAADKVGRELLGFIPASTLNTDATERVAKGDTVRAAFTRTPTVDSSDSPAMTIPEGTDQTVDSKTLTIDSYAGVKIPWTGNDVKHVNNGAGFETIYGDQILQAMRAIANTIEASVGVKVKNGASRAIGTAGTTPFSTNHNDIALVRQILVDNGCPVNDGQVSLVLNSSAGANLRNLSQLQKANEAGGTDLLRQGVLLDLQGLMLRESAGVASHTKGTGAALTTNSAGYAVGATSIGLGTTTMSGTILTGDVITFNGDLNLYVVGTGDSDASNGGTIVLNDPGLRAVIAASPAAITIGNNYTGNSAFHRSAVEVAVRPPASPQGGDAADDVMVIQDPFSGLVFEIAVYKGYRKAMIEVRCVYGSKVWKPNHVATLLG